MAVAKTAGNFFGDFRQDLELVPKRLVASDDYVEE